MRAAFPILMGLALLITSCKLSTPFERLPEVPMTSEMPAVIEEDMDEIMHEFETEAIKNQPSIEASLRPGINDEKLMEAETALGAPLHPEMRTFYRWHDGLAGGLQLFPGYEFYSLEEAIQTNEELNQAYKEKGMQFFMAHEASWLILFPDPAGDGYYYDYKQDYARGGVFFNFRESAYYLYFPSIKNLLAALTECYRQGAYQGVETLDFDLELKIMRKYGQESQQ